jgi:hypothetical protein
METLASPFLFDHSLLLLLFLLSLPSSLSPSSSSHTHLQIDVTRLSKKEKTCLVNCTNRWIDTHEFVVSHLYPTHPRGERDLVADGKDLMSREVEMGEIGKEIRGRKGD